MSALLTIRAFSAELMKIAARIPNDADIQRLLAERRGEEYLVGGRLLSNTEQEAMYAPKLAAPSYSGMNMAAGNLDVLGSKTKKHNHYQTARDYAGTTLKGGLTGLAVLGAHNALSGRFGSPAAGAATRIARTAARRAAGAGAGVAVLDRAYRHDDLPNSKTANIVGANPSAAFRSPGAELAESRQTGAFRSGMVHSGGMAPKPLQIGKKFTLP